MRMQTRLSFFIARTVFQTGTSKKLRSWGVSGLFRQDFKEKGAVGAVKDAVADAGDILIDGVSGLDGSYEVEKPIDILWRSKPLRKTSIDRGGLAVSFAGIIGWIRGEPPPEDDNEKAEARSWETSKR